VVLGANQSSVEVVITPIADALVEGSETVILAINPNPAFIIGSPGTATVTIADGP
jgi:hypothetical protein